MITLEQFRRRSIGIPFVDKGRDYDGWDCWGLVKLAYHDILGFDLPDFTYKDARDFRAFAELFKHRLDPRWKTVSAPAHPMAMACIWRRGLPIHAGLVVPGRRILHVEEGVETCEQPFDHFRIEGFYVPATL